MKLISRAFLLVILLVSLVTNIMAYKYAKNLYISSLEANMYPLGQQLKFTDRGMNQVEKNDTPNVLFLGDSRIAQWSPMPEIEGVDLFFFGVPGETSGQLLLRFEKIVDTMNPDVVVLQAGINDLKAIGALPEREDDIRALVINNISLIINKLASKGIKVVLLTILPAGEAGVLRRLVWSEAINNSVEFVNNYFLTTPFKNLSTVDCSKSFSVKGMLNPVYEKDTLHINSNGYLHLNLIVTGELSEKL